MNMRVQWRSPLKPIGWASLTLLASTLVIWALVTPGSRLLPGWHRDDLSTVLPARIRPSGTFAATAEIPGRVTSVLVAAGAHVDAGQKLAVLESDELLDEVQRAQRRCKLAESRVTVLRAGDRRGPKPAQREQYQTALKGTKAARERLSGYSVADVEKVWMQAKTRTSQIRALLDQQLATAAELDDALAREQDALTNVKSAREHWSRLKQEAELADSQLRMARTEPGRDPDVLL